MNDRSTVSSTARRNWMIAIAAGAITVIAIVLAFASDYLGQQWQWVRPAGESVLLAELVGLIVLERHQLFEPVHSTVAKTEGHVLGMMQTLSGLTERLDLAGQVTLHTGASEHFRTMGRVFREASARNHDTMQVLRIAVLSGGFMRANDPEVATDYHGSTVEAPAPFFLLPTSPANSPARYWSVRALLAFADMDTFEGYLSDQLQPIANQKPLNWEFKFIVLLKPVTLFYPQVISDREVLLSCMDLRSVPPFSLLLRGEQYLSVFARWYDELWASIPSTQLVYSRNGIDQKALKRIRAEIAAVTAITDTSGGDVELEL